MKTIENWVGTWRPHRPRGPIAALYGSPGPKYALPGLTGITGGHIAFSWPSSLLCLLLLPVFSIIILIYQQWWKFWQCLWLFNEGSSEHDPTKYKAPMFSMGMRHKLANPTCSPGPKYSMHPKITRKGHDGTPAFSIYKRRKDPRLVQTPGPGKKNPHT